MPKYMVTLIEHIIYDVEVEAPSIGAAIDEAYDKPREEWVADNDSGWVKTGHVHQRFIEGTGWARINNDEKVVD